MARGAVDARQEAKDETGKPQVAPATVYVIHAWAAPFSELLDALAASEGAADAYFYIGAQHISLIFRATLP